MLTTEEKEKGKINRNSTTTYLLFSWKEKKKKKNTITTATKTQTKSSMKQASIVISKHIRKKKTHVRTITILIKETEGLFELCNLLLS
jgi:hypothetical protein